MELSITNLGPDTILTKDIFLFERITISGTPASEWTSTYIGLNYDLPPNVSLSIRWPLTIDLDKDYDGGASGYSIGAFKRDRVDNSLRNEPLDEQWNNIVSWQIT